MKFSGEYEIQLNELIFYLKTKLSLISVINNFIRAKIVREDPYQKKIKKKYHFNKDILVFILLNTLN